MVDVRQCVIKMEASLQKLVADSKAMQQLVKQSLAKDKQGAAAGKSDAGADAKKGDSAKSGLLDNVISSLSKKLADGIGGALLKVLGLEEKKKDNGAAGIRHHCPVQYQTGILQDRIRVLSEEVYLKAQLDHAGAVFHFVCVLCGIGCGKPQQ